jgi:hypothetical protein
MKKTKLKIKDIYNGDNLNVWQDGEWIYLSFPFCTVDVPADCWEDLKKEFKNIK